MSDKIPECPECGCNYLLPAGRRRRWGKDYQRWECDYCGKKFATLAQDDPPPETQTKKQTGTEPEGKTFYILTCPECNGEKVPVYRTVSPIRYHRCEACLFTFKTVEKRI